MIIDPSTLPGTTSTRYPEPFRSQVSGRIKRPLGDAAGLKNFGVNWVTLLPGSCSALRHWHQKQDEFVYVIEGEVILMTDAGEHRLTPGMAAGFPAGEANGHHLINRSDAVAIYLEVGDRTPHDRVTYPDVDLVAQDQGEGWVFLHQDGTPYA